MRGANLVSAAAAATFGAGLIAAASSSPRVAVLAGFGAVVTAMLATVFSDAWDPERPTRRPEVDGPDGLLADDSGLYGVEFLKATLDLRVATARRGLKPLSVVVFHVEGADDATPDGGWIAATIAGTLRESDVACRIDDSTFAMLLDDTGENGAVWTAERLRRSMGGEDTWIFRAGVASYPAHGLAGPELLKGCRQALDLARDWDQDRIEVAPVL